ncbi:MAG: hypothetical protein C4293_14000, partial [Nitrospiraceae bacterium]
MWGYDKGPRIGGAPVKSARYLWAVLVFVIIGIGPFAGCSLKPPARLGAYLGPQVQEAHEPKAAALGPLEAGLVVINDATWPGSAPRLSDETLAALVDQIRHRIGEAMPITVTQIIPSQSLRPGAGSQEFLELGKKSGLRYLLITIV